MNAEQSFTDPGGANVLNRNYAGNQFRYFTQNDSFFGNEMLVGFYYPMETMEFYCRINIDSLIRQNVTSYGNAPIGGSGTMVWIGQGGSIEQLLRSRWSEWYIRSRPGIFNLFVGNTSNRGLTSGGCFNVPGGHTSEGAVENFGMLTPVYKVTGSNYMAGINYIRALEHEGNNFARANRVIGNHWADWYPYCMVSANLFRLLTVPLTVQIAADPGTKFNIFSVPSNDVVTANTLIDGMVRIQGARIANILSFDLIWQFRGNDSNTLSNWNADDPDAAIQPDGRGRYAHILGAYAWFLPNTLVNGLSFSLGYTAYFRARENFESADDGYTDRYINPLFSGIDFRVQYSGIPNFRFTCNNNISFAKAFGADDGSAINSTGRDRNIAMGLIQNDLLGPNQEQNWFAIYNGLCTDYTINRFFSAHLFLISRYTVFNDVKSWQGDQKPATLFLDEEIYKSYGFNSHMFLRYRISNFQFFVGFTVEYIHYKTVYSYINGDSQDIWDTNTGPGTGSKDRQIGTFTFSVPLRMRVMFRSPPR